MNDMAFEWFSYSCFQNKNKLHRLWATWGVLGSPLDPGTWGLLWLCWVVGHLGRTSRPDISDLRIVV